MLREFAGLTVGVAVDNHYGVAIHSTMLASLGVEEAVIEVLRDGGTPADPAAAAVHALAREVVLERGKLSDATLARPWRPGRPPRPFSRWCSNPPSLGWWA